MKQISQISKELNPRDYLRILMIYFICYDLKKEDKQTMLKSFQKESYREILQNQEFLYPAKSVATSFCRTHPEMTIQEWKAFNLKNSKASYKTLKCEPEIVKLLVKMHNDDLNMNEKKPPFYPYAGGDVKKKERR